MSQYLFLLLIIGCPVMMMFMMRGGHGHGGHDQASNGAQKLASVDELRRRRDELDDEIAAREELKGVDHEQHAGRV